MNANETVLYLLEAGNSMFVQLNHWAQSSNVALPIILSFIVALIFWFVFSYLPERTRRKRKYATRSVARADIFDYIERFHNPRKRRQLELIEQEGLPLTKLFRERG